MNRITRAVPLLVLIAACQDRSLVPTAGRPALAVPTSSVCPSHADFVVSDETSLLSAVASAQPNDTIALSGMIDVTFGPQFFVTTDNLTFTCAIPGSGLRAAPATTSWLFVILSKHVTLERLTLDATNTVNGGVLAFNGVEGPFTGFAEDVRLVGNHLVCGGERVEPCISIRSHVDSGILGVLLAGNDIESGQIQTTIDLEGVHNWRIEGNTIGEGPGAIGDPEVLLGSPGGRFTGNTVQCGGTCFFADGSPRLVVANNQFQSAAAGTGVHLQLGTDGDSVVANTVVTASPSDALQLGGIRVRDGANVVLADNIVRGPWANSMAVTDLTGGDIERNSLAGAGGYGIRLASGASFVPISMTGNRFLANRVTGAALAGISAQLACGNSFIGNDLQGNAGNVGLVFNETTGANTYAGNATLVVDNGAFDCDGDGVNDPNIISGPGMARHGLQLGNGASGTGPVRTVRGITVQ